jgi:glycerol uptake facilitator-like aquaporin
MEVMGVKTNKLTAEFIGTFMLAFAVLASVNGLIEAILTPVIAGLVVFVSVLAIGVVSGCHINPAVTIALYSLKKIDLTTTIAYIAVQLLAGLVAMLALGRFMGDMMPMKLDGGGLWDSGIILAEALGAAVLLFGITAAIQNKLEGGSQAALIGGALTLGVFCAVATGSLGVLNPAVAIGLGVFNLSYILGPILGAILGANAYEYLVANKKTFSSR